MTMALTKKSQEQFGEALCVMGYSLVDVVHVEDEDGDLMPQFDGTVDCLYFTWDFFPPFTPFPNTSKKVAYARDVIVPKIKKWAHVPSAGLDAWTDIFSQRTLITSNQYEDLDEEADPTALRLTHSPGVYGYARTIVI